MINNKSCPLCESNDCVLYGNYISENFLSCKFIIKCNNCDLTFADKLPSSKELDTYYSSGLYYEKVSNPYKNNMIDFSIKLAKTRLELIDKKINRNVFRNVLDIGAGNAQFGIAMLEKFPKLNYDAIEPDIAVSNQWGNWVRNRFKDIDKINDKTYSLVILNQVLEHVNDPIKLLESIYKLIMKNGYIYIDVPFKDYLFKPSVEPHLLFWNKKSLLILLEKVGFQKIFCDTAGMTHKQARKFFNQQKFIQKILNPWLYANKVNLLMNNIGLPKPFDTFRQFKANQYGGDRQWLRCIAQKTV